MAVREFAGQLDGEAKEFDGLLDSELPEDRAAFGAYRVRQPKTPTAGVMTPDVSPVSGPSPGDERVVAEWDRRLNAMPEAGTIGPIQGPPPSVGSIVSGLGNSLLSGAQKTRAGVRAAIGDAIGSPDVQRAAAREVAAAQLRDAETTPAFETATAAGLYGGLASTVQQAPAIAAAIATRNPSLATAAMVAPLVPQQYGVYRGAGATPGAAALGSAGYAAAEYVTERLPMGVIVNQLGRVGATQFLKNLLGREIIGEQAATLAQDAIDKAVAEPDKTWGDYLRERPDAAYQTLLATITQGGIMGGANAGLNATRQRGERQAAEDARLGALEKAQNFLGPRNSTVRELAPDVPLDSEQAASLPTNMRTIESGSDQGSPALAQEQQAQAVGNALPVQSGLQLPSEVAAFGEQRATANSTPEAIGLPSQQAAPGDLGEQPSAVETLQSESLASMPTPLAMSESVMQIAEPTEGLRPGDIVTASGAPFSTRAQAKAQVRDAGPGWRVARGGGGFVVRFQPPTPRQSANARRQMDTQARVDTERDSLFTAIAKLGGINRDEVAAKWGVDPAEISNLYAAGIKRVATGRGLPIDSMAEALTELGYLSRDANGKHDTRELEELFDLELRGSKHYTPQGWAQAAQDRQEQEYFEYLSSQDVEQSGYNDLPEEAQNAIEDILDDYPRINESEERAIAATSDQAGRGLASEVGQDGLDPWSEERGDRDPYQADPQAQGESGAGEHAPRLSSSTEAVDPDADIPLDAPGETLTAEQRANPDYVPFSRSAIKSVDANIRRGRDAMNRALVERSDVHRAMFRNDLGWVDFVYGDAKRGVSHIVKQRMQKDGLTEQEAQAQLTGPIVDTIARGETSRRIEHGRSTQVDILHDGHKVVLVKRDGANGWLLTGFQLREKAERSSGGQRAGFDATLPTQTAPTLTRRDLGADDASIIARADELGVSPASNRATGAVSVTETPEFRRWFGDSKVVGANGEPLIVYHGTGNSFAEFNSSQEFEVGDYGAGYYFTSDATLAGGYAQKRKGSPNVMPAYISLKNPYYIEIDSSKPQSEQKFQPIQDRENASRFTRQLQQSGYDGVIVRLLDTDADGAVVDTYLEEVVAFDPRQIKSATGNRGTFDADVPDVTMSRDGGSGLTSAQVREAVASDLYSQEVDVYQSLSDAPDYVQGQASREGGGDIEGFWDPRTNRVALIAENLASPERAAEVARHELIGHYGLENMVGAAEMGRLAKRVVAAEKEGNKAIATAARQVDRTQPGLSPERRAKEIIAVMAERNVQNSITRRVMDAVRKFLHRIGFIKSNITDAEIADLLREAQAYLREKGAARQRAESVSFSKAPPTASDAFRRWFGNSKVVDGNGDPLVMYRGTQNHNAAPYTEDALIFLTPNRRLAEVYKGGGRVYELYVKAEAPFDASRGEGIDLWKRFVNETGAASYALARTNRGALPYWTMERDLRSWLDSNGVQYDGIWFAENDGTASLAVLEPTQIKSATENRGTYDPENADITFSKRDPINYDQDDLNFGPRQSFEIPEPGIRDKIVRSVQNNKIDLKRVQDAIREAGGIVKERSDAYLSEELYIGRVSAQVDALVDNRVTPLLEAIKESGLSLADVDSYLYARHAPERNAQLAKINPNRKNNQALSGMSDSEAAGILAAARQSGKIDAYERIASMVDRITKESRQRIVSAGLETRDTVGAWEAVYKNYVPLMQDMTDYTRPKKGGFNVRGPESQRALGQTAEAQNIIANVIAQAQSVITRSEKAKVGRALLDLAREFPNDGFWKVDEPPKKRRVNPETGLVEWADDPLFKARENVLTVKENGKEHFIVFNENNERAMEIAAALQNLDAAQLPWAVDAIGKTTRYLAQWITARNPLFWITNFARDVQGAAFNLQDTAIAGKEATVLASIPKAMRGYWKMMRGDESSTWAKYAREFKDAGAETGFVKMFENPAERTEDLEKQLRQMQQGAADPRKLARALVDAIDDANNVIENGVRLSVYQTGRANGMTVRQAASMAKNITVNFNRKGNQSQFFNALYMFFNANVQGNARFFTALSKSRRAQAVAGALVVAGFLMDAVGRAIGGDDELTNRKKYDEIPDFEKERNWIVMLPSGQYLKVPLPIGPHVMVNAGRIMSEMIFRKNVDPLEKATSLVRVFVDSFNPMGQPGSLGQFIAPSVLKPAVQINENKSFTGGPLFREADQRGYAGPAYDRAFRSTGEQWREASKLLSDVTGGDKIKPGEVNIPPEVLRLLFTSYVLPGIAQTVDKSVTTSLNAASGKKVEASQIPALSRFYGVAPEERAQERAYYEEAAKLKQQVGQAKKYAQAGDRDGFNETLEKLGNGDIAAGRRRMGQFDAAEKALLNLNRARKRIEDDNVDDASQREQLERIEERRMDVMRRILMQ